MYPELSHFTKEHPLRSEDKMPSLNLFRAITTSLLLACTFSDSSHASPPLTSDLPPLSKVALLLDANTGETGEISLAARLQSLSLAKRSVRIQALIFTGDETGLKVAEILKQKKKQDPKMDIRIIVDAASNLGWQTQWMYYDLKMNHIEVEGYEALYQQGINEINPLKPLEVNMRYHDKMWIIDGEDETEGSAVVGGLNVANEYFRVPQDAKMRWRDQDVMIKGPIVKDVVNTFDNNFLALKKIKKKNIAINTDKTWKFWNKVVDKVGYIAPHFSSDKANQGALNFALGRELNLNWQPAKMWFIQNRPRLNESYILQEYLQLIKSASHAGGEIQIANAYFVPEPEIRQALKNAVKAGAQVTVLTNSLETNDLPPLTYASRYLFEELITAGIKIYEYAGQNYNEGTIHAKFAVFDRKISLVGSYNLDARSQKLNSETVLVFENTELSETLSDFFREKDLRKSTFITKEQAAHWHTPSGYDSLQMQLSNALTPLL